MKPDNEIITIETKITLLEQDKLKRLLDEKFGGDLK